MPFKNGRKPIKTDAPECPLAGLSTTGANGNKGRIVAFEMTTHFWKRADKSPFSARLPPHGGRTTGMLGLGVASKAGMRQLHRESVKSTEQAIFSQPGPSI